MRFAIDYLLGANYPSVIQRAHPRKFGAGFILNTNKPFAPKTNCWPIITWLQMSGNCPFIKTHAMWADDHIYRGRQHDRTILKELDKANESIQHGGDVIFSPFCERDNDTSEFDRLLQTIERNKDRSIEILNSIAKARPIPGIKTEVHGNKPAPKGFHSYSFDGDQCVDKNVQAVKEAFADADELYFWLSNCNGKFNAKRPDEEGADTTKRPFRKAWATIKLIQSLEILASDRGDITNVKNGIYKSHAEQHSKSKPAAREGKPVVIVPQDAPHLDFVLMNGTNLTRIPRAGNYKDGRPMYRSQLWGFEIAQRAIATQGHALLRVRANGDFIGTVNPGFRCWDYR